MSMKYRKKAGDPWKEIIAIPGPPGTSPVLTVTDIPGGHRLTIKDKEGEKSIDILNGTGAGDMVAATYDPQGKAQDVFKYADDVAKDKLSQSDLQAATDAALEQAKESGEFDGPKGDPGYTPQKGVDYFDGVNGDPGYTPQKGVDYWTVDDRAQMVADTIAALPVAEEVSV